ncbi:MAG: 2OG-Fe(II) oxygenase [Deltaproteobacteria bacterium]|nr:2OG-Fe(II) oxygenase [Deltaproteobacteria bacterium]
MAHKTERSLLVTDNFAPESKALRAEFDQRFANPRSATAGRFVWDYWHVPGQYTALRTPAWTYFDPALYRAIHERLVHFGRTTLGCHDISPPWMSCYIEGCSQQLHGDLPHGPWAFVLSLTHWDKRVFHGGETLMLRDEVLDFWSDFTSIRSVEEPDVLREIEPKFNRLTVFDPRIPHGVREVRGTHDPRHGRLVIHGWFVQPRPCVTGPLSMRSLGSRTAQLEPVVSDALSKGLPLVGLLSVGFTVLPSGELDNVRLLSDTTRTPRTYERPRKALVRALLKTIASWNFPKQKGPSEVTLPIVFEQG